jgi:cell division protein FtsW
MLLSMGLVLVYSSSTIYAGHIYHDPQYFLKIQSMSFFLGWLGFIVAFYCPRRWLLNSSIHLYLISLILLIAVLFPQIGHKVGGARRWLKWSFMHFQPSELLKLSFILFYARVFAYASTRPWQLERILWLTWLVSQLPIVLVVSEPDLGCALVLELWVLSMLFMGGVQLQKVLLFILAGLPVALYLLLATPFRLQRLLSFLDPWAYRNTTGYQVTEALIAIGAGGIWGQGLGQGKQKLFFLPEAHNDFIIAIIGEELGFSGLALLYICFTLLIGRLIWMSLKNRHEFERFLILGVAAHISLPALLNVAVVVGLLPTKGLPLPFVSYGGSHLLTTLTALGLALRPAPQHSNKTHETQNHRNNLLKRKAHACS